MTKELNLNLKQDGTTEKKKKERVKAAEKKKAQAQYEPTWEEVWTTGWTSHTGTKKTPILKSKLTDKDRERLIQVKEAVELGEIGVGVESMKKFSKSHALGLYQLLMDSRREKIIEKMIKEKPSNYVLVNTEEQFTQLVEDLYDEEIIGLDTETNGLDFDKHHIVGISITLPKADYHVYIPIRHENKGIVQLEPSFVFGHLKRALEDEKLGKVLHNAKFDFHMFIKEGIYVKGLVMDTMVAMHVLNENEESFALKNLATKYGKYFGFEDKSLTYEELFGKGGFENTPLDIGTVYTCKDTHLCYKFYKWIDENLKQRPGLNHIYYDIENPILDVCVHMEESGFLIDLDFTDKYGQKLAMQVSELEEEMKATLGDININSNQQLAEVLYDKLGLEDVSKSRSVDADALKELSREYEPLKVLLEYRELNKLLSTYIIPLPEKIWKRDQRLHGSFNQSKTATGRFASNNPNLQNLPYDARKMIVAPEGKLIIGIDYSQIEPRVPAHMSGDNHLQEPYLKGTDLYSTLASRVFKKPIEECGDGTKYRKMMKTGLLAVMYGTSTYTLSHQLGISMDEAEQFIQDFFDSYPDVQAFIDGVHELVDTNGYVETMGGRKRRFPGHPSIATRYHGVCKKIKPILGYVPKNIWSEKKLARAIKQSYWEVAKDYGRVSRQSVNAIIQGSAAEVMKLAMIGIYEEFKRRGLDDWKILATIHDEVLMEISDTATPEEIQSISDIMTSVVKLDIPLKTDIEVMKRWGEGVPFREWIAAGCGTRIFDCKGE